MFVPMDSPITFLLTPWAHANKFLGIFLALALALPSFSLSPPSHSLSLSSRSLLHMLFEIILFFVHLLSSSALCTFCIHFIPALFWRLLMVITIGSCFVHLVLSFLCVHFVLVSIYDCNIHNLIFARTLLLSIYNCNNQLMFCEVLFVSIFWWLLIF